MQRTLTILSAVFLLSLSQPVGLNAEEKDTSMTDSNATALRVTVVSVPVEDQRAALEFYTNILGFQKKHDISVGEDFWLTVVSPADPTGPEVLLEPNKNPLTKTFQSGIKEQGIPWTGFSVDDVQATYEKLKAKGVAFTQEPTDVGSAIIATFDDTCGNLIMLMQEK